ncbi:MAG: hypothetical protein K2Q21_13740 [Chitinophagaceae bacterium]|nr:hypothetical protein [Chitinophagaceae bacterium]
MAQSKKKITPENLTEWLASTGFLMPRNKIEMQRFELLFGDEDLDLKGDEIDPDRILCGDIGKGKIIKLPDEVKQEEITPLKMVARNGNKMPQHILDKIKKNQNKPKDNDDASKNEKPL